MPPTSECLAITLNTRVVYGPHFKKIIQYGMEFCADSHKVRPMWSLSFCAKKKEKTFPR